MVAIKSFNYNIEDDQLIVEIATDNHTKLINNGKIYPLNKSMMNRLKIEGKYRKVFFKDISGEKVLCLIDTDEIEHRYILTV